MGKGKKTLELPLETAGNGELRKIAETIAEEKKKQTQR